MIRQDPLFRLLIASVRDYAIFMLDPTGHIATWNVGAERIKGYREAEIVGKHFSIFYLEEEVKAGKCELELEVAAREGRFEDEGWRLRKDGTRFWANVIISAVRDDSGTLIGFSKVTRDLTERKKNEEDRAARLAAEQANRAKDEFMAMLGHELRNPLAPIVTALQLLKLRDDHGKIRELDVIERQVQHLMRLVDDLLDVSRITRGKVQLDRRNLDLRAVVAKAIEIASPLLEKRAHHLELDASGAPVVVNGDETRLAQAVANLLSNAAKFTHQGGHIRVTVRGGAQATVAVADDGIGISPELLPNVFELFVQGAQGVERGSGGLGIGLTLVKRLIELHEGTVVAESPGSGKGSTFTIVLPTVAAARADSSQPAPAAVAHAGVSRRILVVDDNADALNLLADALTMAGHLVMRAPDAAAALTALRGFTPEVAILDIGLPVMDGYELAVRLRKELAPSTPRLIALTGYGRPSDRALAERAGFDAHFVKPVDLAKLLESIAGS